MEQINDPWLCGLSDKEAFFSLFYEEGGFLSDLEKSARSRGVPIIRREMAQLLQLLLRLKRPCRILEIGTAVGYSALLMSRFLPENGELITLERNPVMWQEAKQNFAAAQKAADSLEKMELLLENLKEKRREQPEKIRLLTGDAAELLPKLEGAFDFIFLDSAKAQYIHFLPELVRLLAKEGLLVTDNVLQNGEIMASRHLLIRRERTTHKRMREYLRAIGSHRQLTTHYFGMADGVTVCIKKD